MDEKKIGKTDMAKLRDIVSSFPSALSAEENVELLKKYHETGDIKIRNQIICGNLRFAVHFSYKYFYNLINKLYSNRIDDVTQDLSLWLLNAVEKFDPSKDVSFCTFAGVVIRSELLSKNSNTRRLKNKAEIVSFSSPASVSKDGKALTYEEVLTDEKFTEDNFAASADANYILKNIVPLLSETEKIVFNESFIERKSQAEIAKILNVSRTQVWRFVAQVRNKVINAYENGIEVLQPEKAPTSFEEAMSVQTARNQPFLREYFQGELSVQELAQKYNMTTSNVTAISRKFRGFCKENNIEFPRRARVCSRHNEVQERNVGIWKDYLETDMKLEEIAEKYSVSKQTVKVTISRFKAEYLQRGGELPETRGKLKNGKPVKSAEDTSSLDGVPLKSGEARKSHKDEEPSVQTSSSKAEQISEKWQNPQDGKMKN